MRGSRAEDPARLVAARVLLAAATSVLESLAAVGVAIEIPAAAGAERSWRLVR